MYDCCLGFTRYLWGGIEIGVRVVFVWLFKVESLPQRKDAVKRPYTALRNPKPDPFKHPSTPQRIPKPETLKTLQSAINPYRIPKAEILKAPIRP